MASSGGLFVSGTTPATKLGSRYLSLSDQLSKRLLQDKLESSMKFEVDDEDDEDDDNDGDDESYLNESKPLSTAINQQPATRVRSHARSLRAMANPSAVWAHFDLCVEDPLRAQCRICGSVVVRGGANPRQCGTTNLHRHLRVHHGGRLIGRRYHGKFHWKNLNIVEQINIHLCDVISLLKKKIIIKILDVWRVFFTLN